MEENYNYNVKTEFFEGPLDLLLHLIRKKKMDILDIKLSEITSEYLLYLKNKQGVNPSREGDFLITASTLIYIKSKSLLPRYNEEEGVISEERKLVNTLIEYDRIKKISILLRDMEKTQITLWKREFINESFESKEFLLEEVSSFQLAEIFFSLLKRKEKEDISYIETKKYTIKKKREELIGLMEEQGYIDFFEYVNTIQNIEDALISFFTILELIRTDKFVALQKELFGNITVWEKSSKGKPQ